MHHHVSRNEGSTRPPLDPMRIAHHPLFTAREKIELLEELRDGVTRAIDGPSDVGFSRREIDDAIDEVRDAAESGAADRLATGDA